MGPLLISILYGCVSMCRFLAACVNNDADVCHIYSANKALCPPEPAEGNYTSPLPIAPSEIYPVM